jgi:hypothetical protein
MGLGPALGEGVDGLGAGLVDCGPARLGASFVLGGVGALTLPGDGGVGPVGLLLSFILCQNSRYI